MNRRRSCFVLVALSAACACNARPVADNPPTATAFAAAAALSMTSIDFGDAPCGGASPADVELEVSNQGAIPLTYEATVDNGAFVLGSSVSGSVDPTRSVKLSVHVVPVSMRSTAGDVTSGNLSLITNDPNRPTIVVPLKVTSAGAMLSLSAPANFGELTIGSSPASMPLALTNTGTQPVEVALAAPANSPFTLTYEGSPKSVILAPGASVPGLTASIIPSNVIVVTGAATVTTSGSVVCGGTPAAPSAETIPLSVALACR